VLCGVCLVVSRAATLKSFKLIIIIFIIIIASTELIGGFWFFKKKKWRIEILVIFQTWQR